MDICDHLNQQVLQGSKKHKILRRSKNLRGESLNESLLNTPPNILKLQTYYSILPYGISLIKSTYMLWKGSVHSLIYLNFTAYPIVSP